MANDVIGAPEIVVIKGRVFWFSPLNDFENSCLESWVKWRLNRSVDLATDEAFTQLESVAGSTQLLYQSIRRTEPNETVSALAKFLDGDEVACDDIYAAWIKINYSETTQSVVAAKESTSDGGNKFDISDIYTLLGIYYKWASPVVVAQMTKQQQLIYLEAINGKHGDSLFFNDSDDYERWRLANVK